MTDLGHLKPTFVNRLHQNAYFQHFICPIAPLKVPMGPIDWVNYYFGVFGCILSEKSALEIDCQSKKGALLPKFTHTDSQ